MTIEELLAAATPLPWEAETFASKDATFPWLPIVVTMVRSLYRERASNVARADGADAEVIVRAVNALPEVLALVKVGRATAQAIESAGISPTPCGLTVAVNAVERALEGTT